MQEKRAVVTVNYDQCYWVGKNHSEDVNLSVNHEYLGTPNLCEAEYNISVLTKYEFKFPKKTFSVDIEYKLSWLIVKEGFINRIMHFL